MLKTVKYINKQISMDAININNVLIKSYLLLSYTLFFSAFVSFLSIKFNVRTIGFLPMLLIYFLILFSINYFKNRFLRIVLTFGFTGFLGYWSSGFINYFLNSATDGKIVYFSLFLTGFIFVFLSCYAVITKKNFSFLDNFLFVGAIVIFAGILFNLFFFISALHLAICGFIIIFSSMSILHYLSSVINDGEDDYIMLTISLYLSLYNIFLNLLSIFSFFNKDD